MSAPKKAETLPDLPRAPQVGDRVKVKAKRLIEYRKACECAGWDVDLEAIREICRTDNFGAGGSRRLFVMGPPFCFGERDVALAWNSDNDRREELRRRGWRV